MLREWNELPKYMRTEEVRPYYEYLKKKKLSLIMKRTFDAIVASIMLLILSPLLITISILILKDSRGGFFTDKKE